MLWKWYVLAWSEIRYLGIKLMYGVLIITLNLKKEVSDDLKGMIFISLSLCERLPPSRRALA